MSNSGNQEPRPHIALLPSAGTGHLNPFLRLAAILAARGCHVTVMTPMPTFTAVESEHMDEFFSTYPNISRLKFQIVGDEPTSEFDQPIFLRWQSINRSGHILRPLLTALSPPITAFFSDFVLGLCICPIADDLKIPNYFLVTSSARFFSLWANLPYINKLDDGIQIPGLSPFHKSTIPPPFFNPKQLFTKLGTSNAPLLSKAKGILLNTFDYFEPDTITAIRKGTVLSDPPQVFPIGMLKDYKFGKGNYPTWLDDQEEGSVVYVSFGSRTAVSRDQMRELGDGLERSGFPFLWVLKTTKEDDGELRDLLGDTFFEKTGKKGIVVKGWAEQEAILAHPAIGGFVSHCGWNSTTEATRFGVPILAWPQHGDQRCNAEVIEKAGMGVWQRDWGWQRERLIKGEEIGEKIEKMMTDEKLKTRAKKIRDEAKKALEANGSSEKALSDLITTLKKN